MTARLPRLRTLAIPGMLALTTLMVAAGHAHAETIDPVGIGDLLPSPQSKVPDGQGTLYEEYANPNLWVLDTNYGRYDVLDPMAQTIADVLMALIVVLGTAVIVIVAWIFQVTSLPELQNALSGAIGGAAQGLSTTLLPAALAVGALVAFAKQREGGGGGGLSQLAWVAVSGVVSISLLSTPQVWVDGVDTTRQVGASVALNATAGGISTGGEEYPFKVGHEPTYTGNGRDDMIRRSSDAVWRSFVATPWCLAEFGSIEVCEKYGKELLDKGTSREDRKEWLADELTNESVGHDSMRWHQGHNPLGRIAVTVPALIVLIIFAALVLALAFASLASLIGALMLLIAGVVFACLWVIPGRPRQWGLRWFDQLLGLTLQSFIATLTLGAVLVVQVVTSQMFGVYQWAPSAGLSIAAALMAFKFRKIIESIVGVSGTSSSPMGAVLGMLTTRSATRALGRAGTNSNRKTAGGSGRGGPAKDSGGGGGGGDDSSGADPGGSGAGVTVRPAPYRRPTPRSEGERTTRSDELPGEASRSGRSLVSVPGARTHDRVMAGTRSRPLPPDSPVSEGEGLSEVLSRPMPGAKQTAMVRSRHSFRQAPDPGAPGPRAIEARVPRESVPPTPAALRAASPSGRQAVTQPPPPARRTAPARRPMPPRPAAEPRPRPDVPGPREQ
ncbi:hypothetical protein ACFY8C_38485 [Streptomyces flavochromogenes]|uniref:TrbL/VirB6 plasmid conjugal transfer protein n=1 Tax=Streptomyces flavochromogenes TaxID=68199 RepID=A0ABW6Y371_9ACTN